MSVDAFADIVASSADDDEVLAKMKKHLQSNKGSCPGEAERPIIPDARTSPASGPADRAPRCPAYWAR